MLNVIGISTMAKKRKVKLTKKQQKQLKTLLIPFGIGLVSLLIGIAGTSLFYNRKVPDNLVWAADSSVKLPKDLRKFLEKQNDCREYRGSGTPTGVGLWGVYQVSQGKYAKIAYGCSWSLSSYIMAVKQKGGWELLRPTQYFAPFKDGVNPAQGALPYCAMLEKYKIPNDIESFCIKGDGSAQSNQIR